MQGVYIHTVLVHRAVIGSTNSPHLPPHQFPPRMVNYHDPPVILKDVCAYAIAEKYMGSRSQLTSFDSGIVEFLACCVWTLPVSLPRRALDSHNIPNNNSVLISSWEFVSTLDYEWSVIRGHRPFGWTIWVRINAHFFCWVSLPRSGRCTSLSCLADLLHYAHIHSYRRNTYPGVS
jgi:hypothetical protein